MSTALTIQENEEWRDHPYIKNLACSSTGRIANIKKKRCFTLHESNGYRKASIRDDGRKIIRFAHRLVVEAFVGISRLQVNHINGNKKDNRIENLEYVTPLQNTLHSIKTGLRTNQSVRTVNAVLNEEKILTIATLFNSGILRSDIAKIMNVSETTVYYLVGGKTYREFSHLLNHQQKEAV